MRCELLLKYKSYLLSPTYRQRWARGRQRRPWGRACRLQSRRRRSGRNRLRRSCQMACGHRAGFHARGSRAPSRSFRSGLQPGRCGRRCTHAGEKELKGEMRGGGVWPSLYLSSGMISKPDMAAEGQKRRDGG